MFDLNRIYNLDCMEAMKEIPDKFFQLAICDPPYGIGHALNVDDTDPAERALSDDDFSIIYGGTELKPLKTRNGIIFIQQKYIAPLEDVLDVVQLYERVTPDGQTYIAAKAGLLIAAVIFPYSVINEKFVKRLEEVARESRRVLNEPPPVRMAERDPDQGDMFAE